MAPILGIGLFFLLLICGGLFALFNRDEPEPQRPMANAAPTVEKTIEDRRPPAELEIEDHRPKLALIPPGRPEPMPIKKPSKPSTPTPPPEKERPGPVAVALATTDHLAPPPHLPPPNRPPAGFASEWVRCGEIRTRVVGATVTRPTLMNDATDEFLAPEMLVVWVETQSLPAGRVTLRRWQNPLHNYVELKDSADVKIKSAKIPSGAWLVGQIRGGQSLPPGGNGIVDVLVFEKPPGSSRDLWLGLAGANVNERDTFFNKIPYEVWSKK